MTEKFYDTVKCEKEDCFGCERGFCQILRDNKFKNNCPFYKTEKEIEDFYKKHPELENQEEK